MIVRESRKLIRKLLVLGALVACLGVVSTGVGTKASSARGAKRLPCCSVCEPDPTIPICRHGCIEGC
jgi:hypothetical protein